MVRPMVNQLRPVALAGNQILHALPLVQVTWPSANAASWQRYVAFLGNRTKGDGPGVIALCDNDSYITGLLVYELEQDLEEGAILTVHLSTGLDLANSPLPTRAILEAAAAKAQQLGCGSVQIRLYEQQTVLGAQLRGLGLSE